MSAEKIEADLLFSIRREEHRRSELESDVADLKEVCQDLEKELATLTKHKKYLLEVHKTMKTDDLQHHVQLKALEAQLTRAGEGDAFCDKIEHAKTPCSLSKQRQELQAHVVREKQSLVDSIFEMIHQGQQLSTAINTKRSNLGFSGAKFELTLSSHPSVIDELFNDLNGTSKAEVEVPAREFSNKDKFAQEANQEIEQAQRPDTIINYQDKRQNEHEQSQKANLTHEHIHENNQKEVVSCIVGHDTKKNCSSISDDLVSDDVKTSVPAINDISRDNDQQSAYNSTTEKDKLQYRCYDRQSQHLGQIAVFACRDTEKENQDGHSQQPQERNNQRHQLVQQQQQPLKETLHNQQQQIKDQLWQQHQEKTCNQGELEQKQYMDSHGNDQLVQTQKQKQQQQQQQQQQHNQHLRQQQQENNHQHRIAQEQQGQNNSQNWQPQQEDHWRKQHQQRHELYTTQQNFERTLKPNHQPQNLPLQGMQLADSWRSQHDSSRSKHPSSNNYTTTALTPVSQMPENSIHQTSPSPWSSSMFGTEAAEVGNSFFNSPFQTPPTQAFFGQPDSDQSNNYGFGLVLESDASSKSGCANSFDPFSIGFTDSDNSNTNTPLF
eukprot:gene4076-6483_t